MTDEQRIKNLERNFDQLQHRLQIAEVKVKELERLTPQTLPATKEN
jgi:hypothetical protein